MAEPPFWMFTSSSFRICICHQVATMKKPMKGTGATQTVDKTWVVLGRMDYANKYIMW